MKGTDIIKTDRLQNAETVNRANKKLFQDTEPSKSHAMSILFYNIDHENAQED